MADAEQFLKRSSDLSGLDSQAFDSKKWLWVPDEEDGFKSASVLETKGQLVKVKLDNGKVLIFLALGILCLTMFVVFRPELTHLYYVSLVHCPGGRV